MTLTTVYQVSERGSRAINKMARYCHQLFAVVAILFFATGTVSAEYIGNYSDWKSLSLTEQNSYIMGLRDSYMLALNESNVMSISFGLDKCEIDLRLSSGMLVEAVSNYYSADTENWSQAPSRAFFDEIISGVCLKYVNEYRAEYGLELWLSPQETIKSIDIDVVVDGKGAETFLVRVKEALEDARRLLMDL